MKCGDTRQTLADLITVYEPHQSRGTPCLDCPPLGPVHSTYLMIYPLIVILHAGGHISSGDVELGHIVKRFCIKAR